MRSPTPPAPSEGAPPRESWKRLGPDERRAQLIAIAEELFQTRPYDEIGVVDVAKAAGITHGLIYHYFANKEALFLAIVEARAKELLEASLSDPTLPVPLQIELGVRGYLDYVERHRVSYLNLFRGDMAGNPALQRICEDTRLSIVQRFIAGIGLGHLPLAATRLSMRGYLGYAENVVLQWLEQTTIPRAGLERMIFAVIGAALRTGLSLDATGIDADQLSALFVEYDRHFALP